MIPKIIKNEEEYRKVLARIEDLMGSDPNTPKKLPTGGNHDNPAH